MLALILDHKQFIFIFCLVLFYFVLFVFLFLNKLHCEVKHVKTNLSKTLQNILFNQEIVFAVVNVKNDKNKSGK